MAFAIKGMVGPLVHPLLLANKKEPQGQALLFQLQLLSHVASGSSGSRALDGVTHTQHGCSTSLNTSASVKVVKGVILSLNSIMNTASWQWLARHWRVGQFCPMLQCSGISQVLLWLAYSVVHTAKLHVYPK